MPADRAAAALLTRAGFAAAKRIRLAGDASARRYERLEGGPRPAVLMDMPPDRLEIGPFLQIGAWLRGLGLSAPEVIASDPEAGLAILEDLGDGSFTTLIAAGADAELLYAAAVDLLVVLQRAAPPAGLPIYDTARFLSEVRLFLEWHVSDLNGAAVRVFEAIWADLLPLASTGTRCLVYVDYHADNLHWLPERAGLSRIGLLDFQDARLGPPAYDLVSLLEDARRDVPPHLASRMTERYQSLRPELDREAFGTAYAVLGAQRNMKILGLFTRLAKRDGKHRYLDLIPRVRAHLERDLAHPALRPLRDWFTHHLGAGRA